jgi:hypothetical protein
LNVKMVAAVILTAFIAAVAHKSHIIGPEYLVHLLPLVTLLGGLFFAGLIRLNLIAGVIATVIACAIVVRHPEPMSLTGMDVRSRWPRWPSAASFLAPRWKDDRMLAPAYGGVGRWYVLHVGGVNAKEWQVQALPGSGTNQKLLDEIRWGVYHYVAVGSTFSDQPSIDPAIKRIISRWPVIWQSDEGGLGPSRLVIYQLPHGVTKRTPLPPN